MKAKKNTAEAWGQPGTISCWGEQMRSKRCSSVFFLVLTLCAGVSALPAAAQIPVDSANPGAAPQGTINLDIAITGNGFQKGAQAQWFVTGTTNPGGVTVNSTTFKGSTQLTANITVAPDAVIGGFDIVVKNANGRTGKGTDKFAVSLKGTPIGCTTSGTPSGFSLATVLNPVQANGAALLTTQAIGNAIRVRPLDLNRDGVVDSLAAFVTSGSFLTTNGYNGIVWGDWQFGTLNSTTRKVSISFASPIQVANGGTAIPQSALHHE